MKGFKNYHHKDENGKTEEFFSDDTNDGEDYNYNGNAGKYGGQLQHMEKGMQNVGNYNEDGSKRHGHFDNYHNVDNSRANNGEYDERKYFGKDDEHGYQNGIEQQSLIGHQEANKVFHNTPHYVPFHPSV